MSFFAAAMWSASALLLLDLMHGLVASLRPSGEVDLVSNVLCQAVAFLLALAALVFVHDRDRPLSDVLGFRRTSPALAALAVALGVALQGPLTLITNAIYKRYPASEEELEAIRNLFRAPTIKDKIALVVAVGLVGPIVEEIFFRGGLLRNLRRRHPAALTLLGTSLLFAVTHVNPRSFLPILLGGFSMGYVRILSGSVWPAILLHVAFNSTSVLVALRFGPDADPFNVPESVAALAATLGLVALYGTVARRSGRCAEARELDVT